MAINNTYGIIIFNYLIIDANNMTKKNPVSQNIKVTMSYF